MWVSARRSLLALIHLGPPFDFRVFKLSIDTMVTAALIARSAREPTSLRWACSSFGTAMSLYPRQDLSGSRINQRICPFPKRTCLRTGLSELDPEALASTCHFGALRSLSISARPTSFR
jgi:hypothetical protein